MKKVMVGGVFNLIHPGHIHFLREAKRHGDYLVVVLASDETAAGKLLFPASVRKRMVESISFVDKVVVGSPGDRTAVIRKENPDVIVLGYDQEMKELSGLPVPVVRASKLEGFSTRDIIKKIKGRKKHYNSSSSSGHCSSSSP